MKIIPFGTNGFFPSFDRQTACYVIPYKNKLIILDAGSGLFRFAEPVGQKLLKDTKEIHLYLSHYHLDHTFGFYAAFKLFKNQQVKVFAPSGRQIFWEFVEMKHFPIDYQKEHRNFQWSELKIGENKIDDYRIFTRKQIHRGEGSLAFRFKFKDGEFAYVTDSEPTQEGVDFVKNVPLLMHEHDPIEKKELVNKSLKLENHYNGNHVTTIGAALIAKEAKAGKLLLIHHFPFLDNKGLMKELKLARSVFNKSEIACDNGKIEF